MESYIPRIQDGMQRMGVAHYRRQEHRWLFYSHDEREMMIIMASGFVIQRLGEGDGIEERAEELFLCYCGAADFFKGALVMRMGIRRLFSIEGGVWMSIMRSS